MSESDKQRQGKHADLYNLYLLMKDIQNDLVRKKPKLKQLKIELPKQLTRLESELTSHPSNEELTAIPSNRMLHNQL
jgi:hypothetical protein